MANQEQSTVQC